MGIFALLDIIIIFNIKHHDARDKKTFITAQKKKLLPQFESPCLLIIVLGSFHRKLVDIKLTNNMAGL